ncbi:MAG: lysoplasmalogenase, partial [Saprospiraceae bacterium]|nr:lysoplasmalogenase [Saprospiraceae bacterium]
LWPDVPQAMRLPVVFYAFTITAMTLSVINLRGQVNSAVHNQLLTGAFLFLISDSILAINKFGHSFDGARMLIMVTYILGQYFLVSGARKTH